MEQTYGSQKDWEEHFQYLLPFFKDYRYEKKDNKPVFMIYHHMFKEENDYINYLDKRCKENGFNGIFIIETYFGKINDELFKKVDEYNSNDRVIFYREPNCAQNLEEFELMNNPIYGPINKVKRKIQRLIRQYDPLYYYSGNSLYNLMIKKYKDDSKNIHGTFFEWDNSSRHGERGYIITPVDQKHFNKYMDSRKNDEYLFINAWNEWCEGMILEPTEENGYKYLEWIREWKEKNELKNR